MHVFVGAVAHSGRLFTDSVLYADCVCVPHCRRSPCSCDEGPGAEAEGKGRVCGENNVLFAVRRLSALCEMVSYSEGLMLPSGEQLPIYYSPAETGRGPQ